MVENPDPFRESWLRGTTDHDRRRCDRAYGMMLDAEPAGEAGLRAYSFRDHQG